jgi:hypothetical protein
MTLALKNAFLGQTITTAGTDEVVVIGANNNVNLNTSNPLAILDIDHNVNINANLTAENGSFTGTLTLNNLNVSTAGHPHNISDINNLQSQLSALTGQAPASTATTNSLFLWQNFK